MLPMRALPRVCFRKLNLEVRSVVGCNLACVSLLRYLNLGLSQRLILKVTLRLLWLLNPSIHTVSDGGLV
jgi:hypothetical protein